MEFGKVGPEVGGIETVLMGTPVLMGMPVLMGTLVPEGLIPLGLGRVLLDAPTLEEGTESVVAFIEEPEIVRISVVVVVVVKLNPESVVV